MRTWAFVLPRTFPAIKITKRDWSGFEAAAGCKLHGYARERIEEAANRYVYLQQYARSMPSLKEITRLVAKVTTNANRLAEALDQAKAPNIGPVFDLAMSGKPGASVTREWSDETLERVRLLHEVGLAKTRALSKAKRTRKDALPAWEEFATELAAVYSSVGGKLSITFDDKIDGYRNTGFFAFVHAVQEKLPIELTYKGTALGEKLKRALRRQMSLIDSPLAHSRGSSMERELRSKMDTRAQRKCSR
jgi:hypothetical protein